jgi:hypothetical protein
MKKALERHGSLETIIVDGVRSVRLHCSSVSQHGSLIHSLCGVRSGRDARIDGS